MSRYLNLADLKTISSRSNRSRIEYAEREELENRPTGFLYPNFIEPMYVFEIEDLQDDSFLILCVKHSQKVYMWKGKEFAEKDMVLSADPAGAAVRRQRGAQLLR